MDSGNTEKKNVGMKLGVRPSCPCCAGGEHRKGRKYTRAKSIKMNLKHKRAKPKSKDHR